MWLIDDKVQTKLQLRDTQLHLLHQVVHVLANSSLLTHPADTALPFNGVCDHLMNSNHHSSEEGGAAGPKVFLPILCSRVVFQQYCQCFLTWKHTMPDDGLGNITQVNVINTSFNS